MIESCKKLPCNHIFHTSCLRSWFQRQQTCPTCRMDVLQAPRPQQATQLPPQQPQPLPQQPLPPQNSKSFTNINYQYILYFLSWTPLLKIEISSNGQNCSILSQKVPKFELYKHNDELFNIYYGIFYVLWTFTDFDRLCKLEKRGDEI